MFEHHVGNNKRKTIFTDEERFATWWNNSKSHVFYVSFEQQKL